VDKNINKWNKDIEKIKNRIIDYKVINNKGRVRFVMISRRIKLKVINK